MADQTKDVVIQIKARSDASPVFKNLHQVVKDVNAELKSTQSVVTSTLGAMTAQFNTAAVAVGNFASKLGGLRGMLQGIGGFAAGMAPRVAGGLGVGAIGGIGGGIGGGLMAGGLGALVAGTPGVVGTFNRAKFFGPDEFDRPENNLFAQLAYHGIGGPLRDIDPRYVAAQYDQLRFQARISHIQEERSRRGTQEANAAALREAAISGQAGVAGVRNQVLEDLYRSRFGPQYAGGIGRAAGFQLAGVEGQQQTAENELFRTMVNRQGAQARLAALPGGLRHDEERLRLQQEIVQRVEEEQRARLRVAEATRQVANTQRDIIREQLTHAQMAFGAMTPGQQRGALELVRLGLGGPGAPIQPGFHIGPGGRVARHFGQPGRFTPEMLGVIGRVSPPLAEKLMLQQAEQSPHWKELQGLLGGMANQAGAKPLAVDFKNTIDMSLKLETEDISKLFDDVVKPKLMQGVNALIEALRMELTTKFVQEQTQGRSNRIGAVTGGGDH